MRARGYAGLGPMQDEGRDSGAGQLYRGSVHCINKECVVMPLGEPDGVWDVPIGWQYEHMFAHQKHCLAKSYPTAVCNRAGASSRLCFGLGVLRLTNAKPNFDVRSIKCPFDWGGCLSIFLPIGLLVHRHFIVLVRLVSGC